VKFLSGLHYQTNVAFKFTELKFLDDHVCANVAGLSQSPSKTKPKISPNISEKKYCNALRSKYGLCSHDGIDAINAALAMGFYVCFLCLSVGYMHILSVCMFYVLCCPCGVMNDNNIIILITKGGHLQ